MDELLKRCPTTLSHNAIRGCEECGVSGDFTLPDYCPDIAVILKCILFPCVQNRQWSGERLLVDGTANLRVLYLDEERRCLHSVEFSLPFSCTVAAEGQGEAAAVELRLSTKYVNCRAVSPRRLEVRGAVVVDACAETVCKCELSAPIPQKGLCARECTVESTYPVGCAEKILTVSEALSFPEALPPSEMLLGGDCRAVIRECKLLSGKAIIKGQLFVHQLYTDNPDIGSTHCLDFVLPFSQIMDLEGAEDGLPYQACVQILSDTEHCAVGPDGESSILEITAKLLIQLRVFGCEKVDLLLDAYHTDYPIAVDTEEVHIGNYMGTKWENTVLPMPIPLPPGGCTEIVDVWVQPQECGTQVANGSVTLKGRVLVCILSRDADGQIVYTEQPEDYRLDYACEGNAVAAHIVVTELYYRVVENQLELKVGLSVELRMQHHTGYRAVQSITVRNETPFVKDKATMLLYYASPGEKIWDIGCRCHTLPEGICQENGLEEDVVNKPQVLLVPIVS